tara:strand:+ start:1380 stop:1574 length:195 start_codon:yes stop_codon:yes gene_type:complete
MEIKFLNHGGKLWILKRKFRKERFSDMNHVKEYREWINCNHVLQDNTHYLFVDTVLDIEFEEIA